MTEFLLATLAFPLNVYAWALYLEGLAVESLHYGLWEPDEQNPLVAQQRASDYLFSHMPPAPLRVLEVGVGLGATARRLVNRGDDYLGVTPDHAQILYIRHTYKNHRIPLVQAYFQQIAELAPLDCIVFQESAQYIQPSDIFQQCQRLLKPGGSVLVMDEIPAGLLANPHASAQAWGFEVAGLEDLTARTMPSVDYLLTIIARHETALCYDLNLSVARLQELQQTLAKRRAAYAEGAYTYHFLKLIKTA